MARGSCCCDSGPRRPTRARSRAASPIGACRSGSRRSAIPRCARSTSAIWCWCGRTGMSPGAPMRRPPTRWRSPTACAERDRIDRRASAGRRSGTMKPARFDYACPASLDEAVALLAAHPGEAKPLAGGQSLMPALNFRLAQPALLVDLRKVPGLDRIAVGADGVRLGARVRWCDIERDGRLAAAHPLLKEAVTHIAHYQIRNRGTVGGSLDRKSVV